MASRTIPFCPPRELLGASRTPLFDLKIDVVTPMFGGGASPGESDSLWPIRGSAIRGQLRFWWRACNAHRYSTAQRLFEEESKIWGSAAKKGDALSGPTLLSIEVETLNSGTLERLVNWKRKQDPHTGEWSWSSPTWPNGFPAYALFSFQGTSNDAHQGPENPDTDPYLHWKTPPTQGRIGAKFRLAIRLTKNVDPAEQARLSKGVEQAIWAWITFGGVGSRTRRGCGALWCATPNARFQAPTDPASWIQERAQVCIDGEPVQSPLAIPRLHGARLLLGRVGSAPNAHSAWTAAAEELREFRQGREIGRRADGAHFGQSYWPEADGIRLLSPEARHRHKPPADAVLYFPRAEFGLPIGFHFLPKEHTPDATLEVAEPGGTRMASPLILKPLAVPRENHPNEARFAPMVLCLQAPLISDLEIGEGTSTRKMRVIVKGDEPLQTHVVETPEEMLDVTKSWSIKPLNEQRIANPREAFVAFVQGRWNIDVTEL